MVLGKLGAEEKILHERKEPIRDIFPLRHSAPQRAAAENPRCKHTWIKAARDQRSHRRNELRRVLIVRMNHDDDVCSGSKRETVTGLLIRAIAAVYRMDLHLDPIKRVRDCRRLILTGIIDNDHKIDNAVRHHLFICLTQSARRVIGRHHDNNFLGG